MALDAPRCTDRGLIMVLLIAVVATFGAFVLALVPALAHRNAERRRGLAVIARYAQKPDEQRHEAEIESRSLMNMAGDVAVRGSYRHWLARALERTGQSEPDAVDSAVRRKVLYGGIGLAWGILPAAFGGPGGVFLPIFAASFGFFIPDLLMYNVAIKRDDQVAHKLADALDLLNLCVESGLSLQAAMSQVSTHQKGPVADEMARVLREMQLGKSRSQAFQSLAERSRQPDLLRFTSAMLQVDRLGIPVSAVLREQASEMRAKRRERAREQAQKVPTKILMPVLLCFLPGLFIIVMGPAAMSVMQAFSQF